MARKLLPELKAALEQGVPVRLNPSHMKIKYAVGFYAAKGIIEYLQIELEALGFPSKKIGDTLFLFPKVKDNGTG